MLLKEYFILITKRYFKQITCITLFILILTAIGLKHTSNVKINASTSKKFKNISYNKPIKDDNSIKEAPGNLKYDNKIAVPVLEYHMIAPLNDTPNYPNNMVVTPQELDEQMRYFKDNGYETITFDDLYNFMKFKRPIPEKSFIISFDDGYESNYIYLPPILKKYGMKAEIAVVTGERPIQGDVSTLYSYFTWQQAKEMQDSGSINIESHTVHHVNLDKSVDLKTELLASKNDIANFIGGQTKVIVYPEGYFDKEVIAEAQEYGYLMGVTIEQGLNYYNGNPFKIKRITVSHWNTGKLIMNKINRFKKLDMHF